MSNDFQKFAVIHCGTTNTIAGYNNCDVPSCVIPSSYLQKSNGEIVFGTFEMLNEVEKKETGDEIYTIIDSKFGVPYNWEAVEKQFKWIYETQLKIDSDELPLIVSLPSRVLKNSEIEKKIIEKYSQIAFDKLNVPLLQIVYEPLAISLSMGKKNSLIIDLSGSGSCITPIIDGVVNRSGIIRNKFGGDFLDYEIFKLLKNKLDEVSIGDNNNSLDVWKNSNTWIKEFKKNVVKISDRSLQETEKFYQEQLKMQTEIQKQYTSNSSASLEGLNPLSRKEPFLLRSPKKTVEFELRERYLLGELLFQPQLSDEAFKKDEGLGELIYKSINNAVIAHNLGSGGDGTMATGHGNVTQQESVVTDMTNSNVMENITNLLSNVIIKGNVSLIEGMETRIINEISLKFPQYKITTFANQILLNRSLQSWTSISTISKLGTLAEGKGNFFVTREGYKDLETVES